MYALLTFIDNEIVDGVTYFDSYDEAYNNAVDIAQGSEQNTLVFIKLKTDSGGKLNI